MKKILFGACIALSVFFAGCSDFLDGSNLKSQIDKQISFANASIFKIDVNVINNDCGSVSEEGINEIKANVPYKLNFSINDEYYFMKWGAFYKNSSDYPEDIRGDFRIEMITNKNYPMDEEYKDSGYIYTYHFEKWLLDEKILKFEDQKNPYTTVTVFDDSKEIVIIPLCARRPYVADYSQSNETMIYSYDSNIVLYFGEEVESCVTEGSDDYVIYYRGSVSTKEYNGSVSTNEYNGLKNIKIYAKPYKTSSSEDRTDITHLYTALQVGKELRICPLHKTYKSSDYYVSYNGSNYETVDTDMDSILKGYKNRYIEIELSQTLALKDNPLVKVKESTVMGYVQGVVEDTEPPVFTDVQYYVPESKVLWYEGVSNYSQELDHCRYKIGDVVNGLNSQSIDSMAGKCRNTNFTSRRVKNTLFFRAVLKDSSSQSIPAVYDAGVDSVWYGLRRIADTNLAVKAKYDSPEIVYNIPMRDGEVQVEKNIRYQNNTGYHYEDGDTDVFPAKENGVNLKLDLSNKTKFPDGLYCFEASGKDVTGNIGSEHAYSAEMNDYGVVITDECKTGDWTKSTYPERKKWALHNTQFWFVKDTTAPQPAAADFVTLGTWYNAETVSGSGFKMDGTWVNDTSRKIRDYGTNENFTSLKVYRICKVFKSDAEAAGWTVTGNEDEWRLTTGAVLPSELGFDYVFSEVYKDDSWHGENIDFSENGTYSIYAYVKDDVGNISKQIKIPDALKLDNTAPKVLDKGISRDSDGQYFYIQMKDTEAGVKKIYYSVTDNNGTDYDTILIPAKENTGIWVSGDNKYMTQDVDYTVDTEKHEIIFNNPITNDSNVYFIYPKDLENASGGTIKFTLEDAAGNKSEEQIVEW